MRALLIFAGLTIAAALATPSAHAQCVGLNELLAIGADPTALASGKVVSDHLSFEWTYVAPTATAKEGLWAFMPSGSSTPTAQLVVRPQRPGQDVLLKTAQANCVRELRGELKSRKLTPQPVTCPSCEAVRYQGPDYDVTLYSQMKGEFPFVVVVHQVPAAAPPAANAKATSLKTP